MKSFNWFRGVITGFPNGSDDIKSRELMVSGIKAERQRRYGKRLLNIWLTRYFRSGMTLKLIRLVDPLSPELVRRLFAGSLSKEGLKMCLLSPPYPEYSLNMARQARIDQKETAVISPIHISGQRKWETSTADRPRWPPVPQRPKRGYTILFLSHRGCGRSYGLHKPV